MQLLRVGQSRLKNLKWILFFSKRTGYTLLTNRVRFKNRRFHVQKEQFVSMSFEEESKKLFHFLKVEGVLREFKMLEETEQKD